MHTKLNAMMKRYKTKYYIEKQKNSRMRDYLKELLNKESSTMMFLILINYFPH